MNNIKLLIDNIEIKTIKSKRTPRGDLLTDFLTELNPHRVSHGYRPMHISYLSKMFSDRKMSVDDMYIFYKKCFNSKNFSATFWYEMKPR